MATKEHAYQDLPVIYRVSFQDIDVTDDVISIGNIDQSVDYPRITEFRIAELQLELKYLDGRYHPENSDNFFSALMNPSRPVSGYKTPVKVEAGFLLSDGSEELDIIFSGIIINTVTNSKTGTTNITCSDNSQDLRTKTVQDFGLAKKIQLIEGTASGTTGVYPLPNAVTPVSEESYTDDALTDPDVETTTGQRMMYKANLDTEGILDPKKYNVSGGELRTEGGPLDTDDGSPMIRFKAPFRDKSIEFLTKNILEHYNIDESDQILDLPTVNIEDEYYASLGRPGYDTEKDDITADPAPEWFWNGFVTDAVVHESQRDIYFLYSGSRASNSRSQIIRYDTDTEEYEVLYTATAHQEWWKMVAIDSDSNGEYDIFYVLGTEPFTGINPFPGRDNRISYTGNTTLGFYNSSIPDPKTYTEQPTTHNGIYTKIWRIITGSSSSQRVWVPNNHATLRPQLARHYTIGNSYKDHNSCDVPDSNTGFELHNSYLYYRYANLETFGVARIRTSNTGSPGSPTFMLEADRDNDGYNSTNHDFTIHSGTLYAAFTWINNNNTSRLKIVSRSL